MFFLLGPAVPLPQPHLGGTPAHRGMGFWITPQPTPHPLPEAPVSAGLEHGVGCLGTSPGSWVHRGGHRFSLRAADWGPRFRRHLPPSLIKDVRRLCIPPREGGAGQEGPSQPR